MGVHGLWRLIESSGKPVPLESLENKVLAVDISIWLHQAVKGFQDAKGGVIPNAHLMGIYHRVCKLLYFKIKPVFVFDGGVPFLKKQTIAKRNQLKSKNSSEADRLQKQMLSTLLKHTAISKVLSEKTKASIAAQTKKSPKGKDELFMLPSSSEMDSTISSSEEEEEFEDESADSTDATQLKQYDLHTIDTKSPYFQSLSLETRHEILTELKETRKQNSWGRLHELPKKSDDFSGYQMKRLLKRQQVQAALDETAKEMGGASLSLAELETLFNDQGIPTSDNVGQRIASDSNTRFLYIKDIKEAMERAKMDEEKKREQSETPKEEIKLKTKAELEEEEELRRAIALSLEDEPSTSSVNVENQAREYLYLENFNDEDFQSSDEMDTSDEDFEEVANKQKLSSAQSYMLEYSGLTPAEISKIIGQNIRKKSKKNVKVQKILPKTRAKLQDGVCSSTNSMTLEEKEQNFAEISNSTNEMPRLNLIESPLSDNESQNNSVEHLNETKESREENGVVNNNNNKMVIENDKILIETENNKLNNIIEDDDDIELISDADSASSEDFLIVEDYPKSASGNLEEIIKEDEFDNNTNKSETVDDDDLFSDIFEDKKDIEKLDEILNKAKFKHKENDVNAKSETVLEETKLVNSPDIKEKMHINTKTEVHILDTKKSEKAIDQKAQVMQALKKDKEEVTDEKRETEKFKEPLTTVPKLDITDLQEMKNNLQKEKIDLLVEKASKERLATNISDQMYQEAQELLELFGVPYVIAPMEAEAQCAFLDEIDLTDGTITDDSDIWLFGGRTVYKNFFDQAKYVLEFKAENIKHNFKLSRPQMVLLALLVGSDYTIGVKGVGPVTALEILSTFPHPQASEFDMTQAQLISGLREFKAWFNKGKSSGPGKSALKNKLKNVNISENFPNVKVVQAYMEPTVETSKETFSWSKPDFVALTVFAREKLAWSSKKIEDILSPVIKRVEESKIQKSIKEYFKTKFKLYSDDTEGKISKRVKLAIERFGKSPEELIAEELELLEKEKQKKLKRNAQEVEKEPKKRIRKNKDEKVLKQIEEINSDEVSSTEVKPDKNQKGKSIQKRSRNSTKLDQQKTKSTNLEQQKTKSANLEQKTKSTKRAGINDVANNASKVISEKIESVSHSCNSPSSSTANDLKLYENVAKELRQRRKRKTELANLRNEQPQLQIRKKKLNQNQTVDVPKELEPDEDIQHLLATTSKSVQRVNEIHKDIQKELSEEKAKHSSSILPSLHNKNVIHQKLRDKSNILRNKLKAIEVFRKSKKGPGYVPKRGRLKRAPKDDAGLSENSDS